MREYINDFDNYTYTEREIKNGECEISIYDQLVLKSKVDEAFNKVEDKLKDISYSLQSIKGISEIDCIKNDVDELIKKLY